jgi:hypothetical protein
MLRAVCGPHLVDPLPCLPHDEPALLALDLEQSPRLLLRPAPLPRPVQRRVREGATSNGYAGAIKFFYRVTLGRPEQVLEVTQRKVPIRVLTIRASTE